MVQTIQYHQLLKRYAFYGPRYDRIFRKYSQRTLSKALEAIPRHGRFRLIDVACGTGLLAEMLFHERPELQIIGVDISPDMLETARRRIPPKPGKIEWLQGIAENLPVETGVFDVLTCTNAFHLVQDAQAALVEFRRVLKPGGTMVLVDWCIDFPIMKARNVALRVLDRQKRQIRGVQEMLELLGKAGFQVSNAERFQPTRLWGMMCLVSRAPGVKSLNDQPHLLNKVRV